MIQSPQKNLEDQPYPCFILPRARRRPISDPWQRLIGYFMNPKSGSGQSRHIRRLPARVIYRKVPAVFDAAGMPVPQMQSRTDRRRHPREEFMGVTQQLCRNIASAAKKR
jgi:hypothetical protein